MRLGLIQWAILIFLTSCTSSRKLAYLSDLQDKDYTEKILNNTDYKIQPDDLLSITVSSLSPESNTLFNIGSTQPASNSGGASALARGNEGYLVDNKGQINFPVLGKIELIGLTREQATSKLTGEISRSLKNPIVNVRFLNFRVTVIGEVNHPGTFNIPYDKINVIEAIGLAGDLTAYGKRENILVIREQGDTRSINRINLGSKSVLNSSMFYLKQNDIVYIEPSKARALQSNGSAFYLPIFSILATLTSVLIFSLRKY
jgi:polysaccharide export outer membrane protein